MNIRISNLILLTLLLFITPLAYSQQLQPAPIDPAIRYGKLENGLTYYIRHNENPKGRADFYIAQNVGAILENDDQNGLAHFLEHMAFNGTKHFPGKQLIEYFEKIGVRFGSNINAYTSLDETVYNLSNIPTAREGIIDTALLVLHDWSGFLSLEGEEIDAERKVILEEWRTRQGADRRIWKEANTIRYPNSQYAKRDVIGDTAVINNFDHQALRDFYHKWYRPDLQAILVVGDVDVDQVEQKIKSLFADIPRKDNFGERPVYPIQDNEEPILVIVTDPEAQLTQISLEYKHDKYPEEVALSVNGYLLYTINSLISVIMSERFDEITMRADAPFVGAYAYYGELVRSKDAFVLMAVPHEGRELEGLKAILQEAEKLKRFGFTTSELERAKINMLRGMEKAYNELDNHRNNDYVQEYIRHFLTNEPIPGIEWEYKALQEMLPQINIDIINQVAESYVTDENIIVSITAPEKEEVNLPTADEMLTATARSGRAKLTAPEDNNIDRPLISNIPKAGKIKKRSYNQNLNATEWTLNNGIKVIIKQTQFKHDEILLSAFSEGGTSKINNVEYLPSAALTTSIVSSNGLGEFSSIDLQRLLTGKIANVSPYIDTYKEGFSGNSSVTDFETMMQLVYLYFTAPRKDDDAFQAMMNMYRALLANRSQDPRTAFSDSVALTMTGHNSRTVLLDLEMLDKVGQDKALEIYKDRFANPADFTFVLTGNIDPADENMQRIICTYLGGLETTKARETYTDRGVRPPKGKVSNYFTKEMQVKKASNFIVYTGELPFTLDNSMNMTALANILNMRYLESIREKEGGTYGVSVYGSITDIPLGQANLQMQFDTDPEKQEYLMGIIHAEINTILEYGPRPDDLQKVKKNLLKQYEENLDENSWWRSAVLVDYQQGINLAKDYRRAVENLTAESVQALLKTIVEQGNVVEVVMMPE